MWEQMSAVVWHSDEQKISGVAGVMKTDLSARDINTQHETIQQNIKV